jgi:hypothetical protein
MILNRIAMRLTLPTGEWSSVVRDAKLQSLRHGGGWSMDWSKAPLARPVFSMRFIPQNEASSGAAWREHVAPNGACLLVT